MATAQMFSPEGAAQGSVELNDAIFGVEFNPVLVHQVVVAAMANRRQGTHKAKTRTEVSGGGRKPYRQKGTGNARHGSTREPQMRGGGIVHGPNPRDYRKTVTVRARRQALCCALSERLRNQKLSVLTGMNFAEPKTKPFAQMISALSPEGRKTLVVTADYDEAVLLSARNIPHVTVRRAADVNVVDVVDATRVVLQQEAVAPLEQRLGNGNGVKNREEAVA